MNTSKAAFWALGLCITCASAVNGCSSDSTNGTGTAGAAGTGTAGSAGTAGSGTAGSGDAGSGTSGNGGQAGDNGSGGQAGDVGGGTAGTGGTGADTATAKFCNSIAFGTASSPMDITLRVEIGTAPNVVSISALTGTCEPLSPADCAVIGSGTAVPVNLIDPAVDPDGTAPIFQGQLDIAPGEAWIFIGDVEAGSPSLATSDTLNDPSTCSALTYTDLFPPAPAPAQPANASVTTWRSIGRVPHIK